MGVQCSVTPLECCSNSILYPISASITPYTDFDFDGVLQQHSNFNSVLYYFNISLHGSYSTCVVYYLNFLHQAYGRFNYRFQLFP